MKNLILSFIFFMFLNVFVNSQEKHFSIRTGLGYYMDTFTSDNGPIIWLEGGYKFKTGFYLNGRLSMASMEWTISDGAFKDYKTIQLRQMGDITFSRPFKIASNHFLEPAFGFKIKKEYLFKPGISYIPNSGCYILSTSYSDIFYEIGFTLCLDYHYQFKSGFYMGLRADTNVIWALGFEGLTMSPLFGFNF